MHRMVILGLGGMGSVGAGGWTSSASVTEADSNCNRCSTPSVRYPGFCWQQFDQPPRRSFGVDAKHSDYSWVTMLAISWCGHAPFSENDAVVSSTSPV